MEKSSWFTPIFILITSTIIWVWGTDILGFFTHR